jgi:DNA polymerase-4
MLAPRMCCLDLDTFFVSVERLLDPSLCGKAVIVGGARGGRGVVTSCSYEARAFGVRSGMSVREASELAPRDAVFVSGHHETYSDYSARAREIVERFSPIVVAASIDEHYATSAAASGCTGDRVMRTTTRRSCASFAR